MRWRLETAVGHEVAAVAAFRGNGHVVHEIAVCEVAVERVVDASANTVSSPSAANSPSYSFHPLRVYWLKTLLTNVIVQVMGKCSVSEQSLPARYQWLW